MCNCSWPQDDDIDRLLYSAQSLGATRQIRLFIVSCARLLWDNIAVLELQTAVESAERYAEGAISDMDLRQANLSLYNLALSDRFPRQKQWIIHSVEGPGLYFLCLSSTFRDNSLQEFSESSAWASIKHLIGEKDILLLMHDIFYCSPALQIPMTDNIACIAEEIYCRSRFDELPILADALQEAGCDDIDLLNHLREKRMHTRGCWALDCIRGRNRL